MANKFSPRSKSRSLLDEEVNAPGVIPEIDEMESEENDSISGAEVSMDMDKPQKAPVHHIRVRTNRDHRCCVGGVWYDFKKGIPIGVPDEVKEILLKAGLLMPL